MNDRDTARAGDRRLLVRDCPECRYDLRGAQTVADDAGFEVIRCPECGFTCPADSVSLAGRMSQDSHAWRGFLILMLLPAFNFLDGRLRILAGFVLLAGILLVYVLLARHRKRLLTRTPSRLIATPEGFTVHTPFGASMSCSWSEFKRLRIRRTYNFAIEWNRKPRPSYIITLSRDADIVEAGVHRVGCGGTPDQIVFFHEPDRDDDAIPPQIVHARLQQFFDAAHRGGPGDDT